MQQQCSCVRPEYHRARIVYRFGPIRVTSYGRWCVHCGELIPDDGPVVRLLTWAWLRFREELSARVDCIEHDHATTEASV